MTRTIVLPKELEERLYGLIQTWEESNGILLYRKVQGHCFVEHLFMTGIGTEGNVKAFQERMNVVNEFFRAHPEYKYIKFHAHTKGTIEKHGQRYAREFSSGDRAGTQEQLRHNPEFIALLVTPETILLDAPDNPQLRTCPSLPKFMHEKVQRKINEAAERIGIRLGNFDLGRFSGTRRLARRRPFEVHKRAPRSKPR